MVFNLLCLAQVYCQVASKKAEAHKLFEAYIRYWHTGTSATSIISESQSQAQPRFQKHGNRLHLFLGGAASYVVNNMDKEGVKNHGHFCHLAQERNLGKSGCSIMDELQTIIHFFPLFTAFPLLRKKHGILGHGKENGSLLGSQDLEKLSFACHLSNNKLCHFEPIIFLL